MSEDDYALVMNLARLRDAKVVMSGVIGVSDGRWGVLPEEVMAIHKLLFDAIEKVNALVEKRADEYFEGLEEKT